MLAPRRPQSLPDLNAYQTLPSNHNFQDSLQRAAAQTASPLSAVPLQPEQQPLLSQRNGQSSTNMFLKDVNPESNFSARRISDKMRGTAPLDLPDRHLKTEQQRLKNISGGSNVAGAICCALRALVDNVIGAVDAGAALKNQQATQHDTGIPHTVTEIGAAAGIGAIAALGTLSAGKVIHSYHKKGKMAQATLFYIKAHHPVLAKKLDLAETIEALIKPAYTADNKIDTQTLDSLEQQYPELKPLIEAIKEDAPSYEHVAEQFQLYRNEIADQSERAKAADFSHTRMANKIKREKIFAGGLPAASMGLMTAAQGFTKILPGSLALGAAIDAGQVAKIVKEVYDDKPVIKRVHADIADVRSKIAQESNVENLSPLHAKLKALEIQRDAYFLPKQKEQKMSAGLWAAQGIGAGMAAAATALMDPFLLGLGLGKLVIAVGFNLRYNTRTTDADRFAPEPKLVDYNRYRLSTTIKNSNYLEKLPADASPAPQQLDNLIREVMTAKDIKHDFDGLFWRPLNVSTKLNYRLWESGNMALKIASLGRAKATLARSDHAAKNYAASQFIAKAHENTHIFDTAVSFFKGKTPTDHFGSNGLKIGVEQVVDTRSSDLPSRDEVETNLRNAAATRKISKDFGNYFWNAQKTSTKITYTLWRNGNRALGFATMGLLPGLHGRSKLAAKTYLSNHFVERMRNEREVFNKTMDYFERLKPNLHDTPSDKTFKDFNTPETRLKTFYNTAYALDTHVGHIGKLQSRTLLKPKTEWEWHPKRVRDENFHNVKIRATLKTVFPQRHLSTELVQRYQDLKEYADDNLEFKELLQDLNQLGICCDATYQARTLIEEKQDYYFTNTAQADTAQANTQTRFQTLDDKTIENMEYAEYEPAIRYLWKLARVNARREIGYNAEHLAGFQFAAQEHKKA